MIDAAKAFIKDAEGRFPIRRCEGDTAPSHEPAGDGSQQE
jgi:hypothetical protein